MLAPYLGAASRLGSERAEGAWCRGVVACVRAARRRGGGRWSSRRAALVAADAAPTAEDDTPDVCGDQPVPKEGDAPPTDDEKALVEGLRSVSPPSSHPSAAQRLRRMRFGGAPDAAQVDGEAARGSAGSSGREGGLRLALDDANASSASAASSPRTGPAGSARGEWQIDVQSQSQFQVRGSTK